MKIQNLNGCIFPTKEMYLLSCSDRGKLPLLPKTSAHYKRKAQYENLHLLSGMPFTYENGFPKLKPYNGTTDFTIVPYTKRRKAVGKGQFAHFFSDDYQWGDAVWNRLEEVIYELRKFDGMFNPDYSLFADPDIPPMFNKIQTFKSRAVGAYAQAIGYNVIPTASCGDVDSLSWCYDGLPEHSVIGFCGTGLQTHSHREHWEYAIRALEEMKQPTLIIVYGPPRTVPGLTTPLQFIQDEITKIHRKK